MVAELGTLRASDITVLDMEASIEHLSRGTVRHVETLLIVTEPYYRALETLGRTTPLARELGIPRILVVANKVHSDRDEAAIREYSSKLGLDVAVTIPFDEAVQEADRQNRALIDHTAGSMALQAIEQLVDDLGVAIAKSDPAPARLDD